MSVYLRDEGDSLRGIARSWTDVILIDDDGVPIPLLAAEAVARRVPCVDEVR